MTKLLKTEFTAFLAAIGLAFSLFQGFGAFIEFCQWMQPFIYYWREYTYQFWRWMFFFIPWTIPNFIIDTLNMFALLLFLLMRVLFSYRYIIENYTHTEILDYTEEKYHVFLYKYYLPALSLIGIFVMFPVFGYTKSDNIKENEQDFFCPTLKIAVSPRTYYITLSIVGCYNCIL